MPLCASTRRASSRRRVLAGLTGLVFAASAPGMAWADKIIMVSRERLLRESAAATALREAEDAMTKQLQASVDAAEAQLAAEEAELTKLRAQMAPAEFEERAKDFDRRIRNVRRQTQERAAFLNRGFQEARSTLLAALPELFEKVRLDAKADVVLSADHVLAATQGVDVTDQVLQLMDAEGPRPPAPKIDLASPLLEPAGIATPQGQQTEQ